MILILIYKLFFIFLIYNLLMFFRSVISSVLVLASLQFFGEEYIIGKAHIEPGIDVVFEAAPKDIIYPIGKFLEEDKIYLLPLIKK